MYRLKARRPLASTYSTRCMDSHGTCFWDGWPCANIVRRMAKHTLKEFEEMSEVSNTSLNARIFRMVSQDGHSLFH